MPKKKKRKVKKKFLQIKDSKIKKLYKNFEESVSQNIKKESFAIAVSGGADSLCLSYFANQYCKRFRNKMHVLIVNHNLRRESYLEALKVRKILFQNLDDQKYFLNTKLVKINKSIVVNGSGVDIDYFNFDKNAV